MRLLPTVLCVFRAFALGGASAVAAVALGQAENVFSGTALSNSQHGFTITLNRVEAESGLVRLFLSLENAGETTVRFFDVNTELWRNGKRHEPQRDWDTQGELPGTLPPGAHAKGFISFAVPGWVDGDSLIVRFQRAGDERGEEKWDVVEYSLVGPFDALGKTAKRTAPPAHRDGGQPRMAIIKADDLRAPSANWDRFIELSHQLEIKVSIGIICDSLLEDREGYHDWLRNWQDGGKVEFWNHGWDHKRWQAAGRTVSEFGDSGYAYQKRHLTDAQEIVRRVLGAPPVALGTPWNDFDADTIRVVNEDPSIRLFFGHKEGVFDERKVVVRMLQSEADGTGRPNFGKFRKLYESHKDRLGVISLQFHPPVFEEQSFTEYERILDFLLSEGWSFMLPREYLEWLDRRVGAAPAQPTATFQP